MSERRAVIIKACPVSPSPKSPGRRPPPRRTKSGPDADAEPNDWHLRHGHGLTVSRTTISRTLVHHGAVILDPSKRPRSSNVRSRSRPARPVLESQLDFTRKRLKSLTVHFNAPGPLDRVLLLSRSSRKMPQPPIDDDARVGGHRARKHREHENNRRFAEKGLDD